MSLFNVTVYYHIAPAGGGWAGFLCSGAGLRACSLPMKTRKAAKDRLFDNLKKVADVDLVEDEERCRPYAEAVRGYFDPSAPPAFEALQTLPLDWSGAPPFYQTVWRVCRSIPPGQTRTYQWLATQAGSPRAVRAAGQALAHNPTPLFVPCHRVVAADGGLGGFSAGLEWKERLLELEKRHQR
ncbi:MAG: methylated-DNA--[protein]-cysteine S-methyltransferase [Candidatus Sumerlaeia bacterium]